MCVCVCDVCVICVCVCVICVCMCYMCVFVMCVCVICVVSSCHEQNDLIGGVRFFNHILFSRKFSAGGNFLVIFSIQ